VVMGATLAREGLRRKGRAACGAGKRVCGAGQSLPNLERRGKHCWKISAFLHAGALT